jgi:HlyD family secretion protein
MKKNYIYYSVAAILVIAAAFYFKKGNKEEIIVTVEKPEKRDIIETVAGNGKIQPVAELKISADVSGEIIELNIEEGQAVKKGDLLLVINPNLYMAAVQRTEAALNNAKANFANSKARTSQAEAQLTNATAQFNRNKKLYDDKAISKAEFENSEANYQVAIADLEAAKQTELAAAFNIKSAEASLKEANDNLLRTKVYCPIDGTVSKLNKEKGERVVGTSQMEGTEILRIANLELMEVVVEINENDVVRINKGDSVIIEVDAYKDEKFKGLVTQIANSAKMEGLGADQVTSFEIKIRVLETEKNSTNFKFRPGMSANVDIVTNKSFKTLSIPIQSVTLRDAEEFEGFDKENDKNIPLECVFIYENGKAVLRKVKTGVQDTKYIELKEGMTESEDVVTGPYGAIARDLKNNAAIVLEKKEK